MAGSTPAAAERHRSQAFLGCTVLVAGSTRGIRLSGGESWDHLRLARLFVGISRFAFGHQALLAKASLNLTDDSNNEVCHGVSTDRIANCMFLPVDGVGS